MSRKIASQPESYDKSIRKIVPLREAYDEFVHQMIAKGYAEKTIDTYNGHVIEFIDHLDSPKGGPKPKGVDQFIAASIGKSQLIEWEGVLRCERGNRDTTVQTKVKSIRTFLYWCMDAEQGYCKRFSIPLPKAEERLIEPYTTEELDLILAPPTSRDLTEWRNWAAVNFIMRTGIRRSSACEMKWPDVDFERKVLFMRHAKNRKQQLVPLPQEALEVLQLWMSISPVTEKGYVFFSTYTEGKLMPNSLTQAIRAYNLRRGVKKTSVHLMRHTYATTYLRKGGSSDKLQKILGHQTSDMTQRYVHLVIDDLAEDIDKYTI